MILFDKYNYEAYVVITWFSFEALFEKCIKRNKLRDLNMLHVKRLSLKLQKDLLDFSRCSKHGSYPLFRFAYFSVLDDLRNILLSVYSFFTIASNCAVYITTNNHITEICFRSYSIVVINIMCFGRVHSHVCGQRIYSATLILLAMTTL